VNFFIILTIETYAEICTIKPFFENLILIVRDLNLRQWDANIKRYGYCANLLLVSTR